LLKGAALSSANRKDEAIKVFRHMIQEKIEAASAYNNLAVIYASKGEFELARTALEWAIRDKPDYVTAQHNLGNVYANLASMAYKRALQLDRSDRSLPAKLVQLGEVLGQPVAPGIEGGQPDAVTSTTAKTQVLATATPPSFSVADSKRSSVVEANLWTGN
jgi:tetratricopeptide (TPR) repeat protein